MFVYLYFVHENESCLLSSYKTSVYIIMLEREKIKLMLCVALMYNQILKKIFPIY